jgi:hypothetical protein
MRAKVFLCCLFLLSTLFVKPLLAQEAGRGVREKGGGQAVPAGEPEGLRAFQAPRRVDADSAGWFVTCLLFGVVGAFVLMFLLIGYFFEPPAHSQPYRPTTVDRPEGFTAYRKEPQSRGRRHVVDEEE